MADINVSTMYEAIYVLVESIIDDTNVPIKGGRQNIAQPVKRDNMGMPEKPYIVIVDIPTMQSQGNPDVNQWTETSPSSVNGSQDIKDDFTGVFEIHQVGGRGELLQKIKASVWLDQFIEQMRALGIACWSTGPSIPVYNEVNENWGQDVMSEFTFAGSYRLNSLSNKITGIEVDTTNIK